MMRWRLAVLVGLIALSACQAPGVAATDSQSFSSSARERATLRVQLAAGYLEAGQPTIALAEVEQALAADPDFAVAYHVRALIEAAMGRLDRAERSFAAALEHGGDDGELLRNYGTFLRDQGRHAQAMALLRRALAVNPADRVAALGIGELYYRQGDLARAAQAASRLNAGSQASAGSLWLEARVAHRQHDATAQQALIARLRQSFPASRELSAYEQGAWDE